MAYGLKYLSEFYNTPPFKKKVEVQISKRDYTGNVINVRTSSVLIESNFVDDDTPIIGKGAEVSIVANSNDMTFLEDLLLSYEREFECVIIYDGEVAFRGYSLCDLNERQLLPYAVITVKFTDYLHRSEGQYPSTLQPMGGVSNLMSVIQSILIATDFDFPLYINSTLFEDSMFDTPGDSFLTQVCVQNSVFYSSSFDYDNVYDAVNKALKSFNAYLYSHNDKWIIERLEDIGRDGDWVRYDPSDYQSDYDSSGGTPDGATVTSLRKIINKQAGDFEYAECSQHVEYDSGLHTLILRLRDKKLDTLIFNDWGSPNDLPKTPYYAPLGGTLEYRTWYVHNDFTNLSSGEDQNDIKTWIHYTASETFVKGLCYNFAIYFNRNVTNDTIFTISYSQSTNRSMAGILRVGMFFFLRIDSGSYNNYLVKLSPPLHSSIPYHDGREDLTCINLIGPNSVFYNNNAYNDQVFVISESEQKEKTWTLSKEFNLTRMPVRIYNSGTTYINYNHGLKALLGDVEFQKFNITFCSPVFSLQKTNYSVYQYGHMFPDVYLGDINASVNVEEIDNEITYTLNENFIKTKEVDLYLFDLKNMNYGNALLEADGFTRTNLWSSEKSPTPIPLYEIFAKSLFRKYGRTIHRLKGTIKYDGILKPFTIIEDDTVLKNDSNPISFLLNKFTWDLNQGTYDITADEYSDEDVTVDGVMYDSEGDPEWYGQLPDTPENLRAMMRGFLYHPIKVMWDAVPRGVTGYVLLRRPYYASGGVLVDEPKIIYVGKNTECMDFLTDIATYSDGMDIHYKVASYRGDFSLGSLYSNEITVNWHK